MIHMIGTILEAHNIVWELVRIDDRYEDDAIAIKFPINLDLRGREALNYLKVHLTREVTEWLEPKSGKWRINLAAFRKFFDGNLERLLENDAAVPAEDSGKILFNFSIPSKISPDLLQGELEVSPEISQDIILNELVTEVSFIFTYEDLMNRLPKRIFLSHKSADKPMVRTYRDMLKTLGFEPWMDEDDLKAGDGLHRGIARGFRDSCAVVFFITKNYVDEKYLKMEVDYAIAERLKREEGFRIISLVIADGNEPVNVPELLQQFVYKTPGSQFEALTEIIKALPIKLEGITRNV